jgi:hypothetical protein
VIANGGGAASGASDDYGTITEDPSFNDASGATGPAGSGSGGAGFARIQGNKNGGMGATNCSGGGGGGGGGYIKSSVPLSRSIASAGRIDD